MVFPPIQPPDPISPDFTVPSSRQGMSGAPIDWAARRRAQEAERNRKEIERMAQGAVSGTSSIVTERTPYTGYVDSSVVDKTPTPVKNKNWLFKSFDWVDNTITKPGTALALSFNIPLALGVERLVDGEKERNQETRSLFVDAMQGERSWGDVWDRFAEIQNERPTALRIGSELLMDPLNAIPFGLVAKPVFGAIKGARAASKIERGSRVMYATAEKTVEGVRSSKSVNIPILPTVEHNASFIHNEQFYDALQKIPGSQKVVGLHSPNAITNMNDPVRRAFAVKPVYEEQINNNVEIIMSHLESTMPRRIRGKTDGPMQNILPGLKRKTPLDSDISDAVRSQPDRVMQNIPTIIGDRSLRTSLSAKSGVRPEMMDGYIENARTYIIRQRYSAELGEELSPVQIAEYLKNPSIMREVDEILSTADNLLSADDLALKSEALKYAVRDMPGVDLNDIYWNEMMQNPNDFDGIPDDVRQWMDEVYGVQDDMREYLNFMGIKLDTDIFGNPLVSGYYYPNIWKMVGHIKDVKTIKDRKKLLNPEIFSTKLGQKKFFEEDRLFDFATDAIHAGGYRPFTAEASLRALLKGQYQMVAERNLVEQMGPWNKEFLKRIQKGKASSQRIYSDDLMNFDKIPDATKEYMKKEFRDNNAFVKQLYSLTSTIRTLQSSFDGGVLLIQTLPLLFLRPVDWSKTAVNSIRAMGDPGVINRMMTEHYDTAVKLNTYNQLNRSSIEMIEGFTPGGWLREGGEALKRVPVAGVAGKVSVGTMSAFERQFEAALLGSKIYLWEAMEPMVLRKARDRAVKKGLDEAAEIKKGYEALAAHVGKLTGTVSMANLGIRPNRARAMGALLMYAPRYRLATYGLMGDALQLRTERAKLAQLSLAKMLGSGLLFYAYIAHHMGQEPKLDPRPKDMQNGINIGGDGSEFMSVKIGDNNVGFGSAWISTARFLGNIIGQTTYQTEGGLINIDERDSAVTRFIRGQTSPLSGMGWDIATGRNYMGEPMPENFGDLSGILEYAGDRALPFYLSSMADYPKPGWGQSLQMIHDRDFDALGEEWAESAPGILTSGISEFGGLRGFPVSKFSQAIEIADLAASKKYPRSDGEEQITFSSLNSLQKKELLDENPDVTDLMDEHNTVFIGRGTETAIQKREYNLAINDMTEDHRDKQSDLVEKLEQGDITPSDFREELNTLGRDQSIRYEGLEERFPKAIEAIAQERENPKAFLEDTAYIDYIVSVVTRDFSAEDNQFEYNYKERHKAEEDFKNRWTPAIYQYVQTRRLYGAEPLIIELRQGQKMLDVYWNVGERILKSKNLDDLMQPWETYRTSRPFRQKEIAEQYPVLKQVASAVTKARQMLREENQLLDAFLFKWGYTDTLRHEANKELGFEYILKTEIAPQNIWGNPSGSPLISY